jgi:hypothetical protein
MVASSPHRAVVPALAASADPEIERVRTFARVFDRYGLDALLGFVLPGVGDIAGSLLGLYIVSIAIRRRYPAPVVVRMLLNLGLDMVVGVVPLVGDLADFVFRANQRNLALLEDRGASGKARASDWLIIAAVGLGLAAVVGLVIYGVAAAVHALRS